MVLSACTSTVQRPDTPADANVTPVEELDKMVIIRPKKKQVFISKPVVRNLLKKAQLKSNALDYESAITLLERGITISPNNPLLWQRMADVRLKQGDFQQARQLAKKSNVLVEANNDLRLINMRIIDESRRREKLQKLGGTVLH